VCTVHQEIYFKSADNISLPVTGKDWIRPRSTRMRFMGDSGPGTSLFSEYFDLSLSVLLHLLSIPIFSHKGKEANLVDVHGSNYLRNVG